GFMVADRLAELWGLGRAKERFRGRLVEGTVQVGSSFGGEFGAQAGVQRGAEVGVVGSQNRPAPRLRGGQRVALLCPHTYMNDAGRSVGPARGALKVPLERVLVVHDEIDLPFGDVRTRLGGGLAGHNGLKSLKQELGSADFMRVRVGVGRPKSTDPEIVSSYVLGRFREPPEEVGELIDRACEAVEHVVLSQER
ncbi:MAG TPA: aminoacyl-tRNA hydrolase, partial [Solirubrobacteraceae bacterium]|nr:aminoacyl-tRNA hydrolase [Solirubrobacteraceae bacterium]